MVRRGCNSLVRAEEILTRVTWVGMASYMGLLNKFQYPKGSLLNLLNAMVDCGFLIKNKNSYYSLEIKDYELGCQASHHQNISEMTKRPMQELSLKSRLVCHPGMMENISAIYLDEIRSPDSVSAGKSWISRKLELHITTLGKALLAWKAREELDYFLEAFTLTPHTRNTSTDKKLFLGELRKTRLRGWTIDNEESTYGTIYLNMLVFDMYNRVDYTISLSGDPIVYSRNKTDNCLELLRRYAKQMSYGLRYGNENEHLRKGD